MSTKSSIFIIIFLALFITFFQGFCQKITTNSLEIIKFETEIGDSGKDSVWDLNRPIKIPTQPTFLSITVKEKNEHQPLNLICHIYEPIKNYDTLRLGSNPTINFSNLSGGDYELTFINLTNQHQTKIKFSIEVAFWEKWWFSPFVFLVISFVLGLIFYLFYLVRLRSQLQLQSVRYELEIKALRSQMNPHFIFNCLNTIDFYILNKKFIEASVCLQKFSKLVRQILENSENQTISITQELETLQLYIEIEQERFANSFTYQFDVEEELLKKNYQIPPLLLQPFVENAILHGFRNLKNQMGALVVMLKIEATDLANTSAKVLYCQIRDNGVGRKASQAINANKPQHKSMGMNVTMERITAYQSIYGETFVTQIADNDHTAGTKVDIRLPLILE